MAAPTPFVALGEGRSPPKTVLVSAARGRSYANGSSSISSISRDGDYVAFSSDATDLVRRNEHGVQVFLRHLPRGRMRLVSVPLDGQSAGNSQIGASAVSVDGSVVTFSSSADNLVRHDTNGVADVFVRNMRTGTTRVVSVSSLGTLGNGVSDDPSISANGRYVVFESRASNLVHGDKAGKENIFVHDRRTGKTEQVDTAPSGDRRIGGSSAPSISANGRFVSFTSTSSRLVPGDTNRVQDVFVWNRTKNRVQRVDLGSIGTQADGPAFDSSVSSRGPVVAFESGATNLVGGDTNNVVDVYAKDVTSGGITRVDTGSHGAQADGQSLGVAIDPSGRAVAFSSEADNLVPRDTNQAADVFVRDRRSGKTRRVDLDANGRQLPLGGGSPALSRRGRDVSFAGLRRRRIGHRFHVISDIFRRGPLFLDSSTNRTP